MVERPIVFAAIIRVALHFSMADASVRFVSDGVNYTLYRAMSTRNGGELVNAAE